MSQSFWTPQTDAKLTRLWMVEKLSASVIAEALGIDSRSAVLGRARRLGLCKGPVAPPWSEVEVQRLRDLWEGGERAAVIAARLNRTEKAVMAKIADLRIRRLDRRPRQVQSAARKPPTPLAPSPAAAESRHWSTRKRGECSWPIGTPDRPADQLNCCAPTNGDKWCPAHSRAGYAKGVYGDYAAPPDQLARSLRRYS